MLKYFEFNSPNIPGDNLIKLHKYYEIIERLNLLLTHFNQKSLKT